MADHSNIGWTDATWNIITGCSVVSPGCKRCYAMRLAGTRLKDHWSRKGLTQPTPAGPVWTGEVRWNEAWYAQPLQWRRGRMIFVCAHGDLFHENVSDYWIARVFAVMAVADHHRFQVLTKRPHRMAALLADEGFQALVARLAQDIHDDAPARHRRPFPFRFLWPLPHVWVGTSVEDQTELLKRLPALRRTPAAIRYISAEPLLGPLQGFTQGVDWIIVGGESQDGARPMHPHWVRRIAKECRTAGVPLFFKQWGNWAPNPIDPTHWVGVDAYPKARPVSEGRPRMEEAGMRYSRTGWPTPAVLDGRTWTEFPGETVPA